MIDKKSTMASLNLAASKSVSMLTRLAICSLLLLITACGTNDPLIRELEAAYLSAGKSVEEKDALVSGVTRKHFPAGMNISEALQQMQAKGFQISEYRYEGARLWPSGELRPYTDESVRRNIQARFRKNQFEYVAEKEYGWKVIVAKRVVIVIDSDGKKIVSSRGFIHLDGI